MTTVARREPTSPSFEVSNSIPIAHLSPSSVQTSSYIAANVALVWPYSSATGNLALLLAEPDVRLRKHKGQVKVVFRDGCAREIAKTKVGIGDTVKLALAGCEWKETGDAVSTPGKKIDWDLEFRGQVIFQVVRENGQTSTVSYTAPESNFPAQNGIPGPTDSLQTPRVSMNSVSPYGQSTIRVQLTPFKTARKSAGGTFVDASLDPFADDDGYVLGKGRKRTKFARHSGSWSLVDSDAAREPQFASQASPSDVEPTSTSLAAQQPEHDAAPVEPGHAEHEGWSPPEPDHTESGPMESIDAPTVAQPIEQKSDSFHSPVAPNESAKRHISASKVVMGPPLTPLRIAPQPIPANADAFSEERSERTSTPRLQPLTSPGLPLVSPLIRRSGPEVGYFPLSATGLSQLDASGGGKGQPQSLENNTLSDGPVLEQFGDIQHSSKEEQHVPLNSASEVSLTTDKRNGPEQDTETHSSESVQSVEFSTIPQVPGSPQEAPRSSRSPSPVAAKQHQEPPLSDKSPSLSPNALAILVEGEDEDMYGPPKEISTASSQVVNSTSHEQAQSRSDNAEFSSPATNHALHLAGESGQDVAQSPVLRQPSAQEHVTAAWKEQITVGAVECQSPGTYPAPPFPFKQNWHKRRESYSSSRRSSYHSQTYSLDGSVDERTDLSPERDSPENTTSQLVDLGSARVETPSISSKSGSPTLSSPMAPAPEESQRIPQDKPSETSAMPASAGGHHYVQPYVEEVPEGAPTPQVFTAPDGGEQPHESPTPQKAQHIYNQPDEPVQVTSAQQQPPAPSKTEAIQEQELQGQLPTPDQTQEDREEEEEEEEDPAINMEFAEGLEHQTAPFAPRSPEIRQGPAKTPDEQDAQAQLNAATATPATPAQVSVTQAESTNMRRTSQRLFVKKSVVAVNVSSPYFSPRNGVVAPSSPLFVQEGPSATESDLNNSSSSQLEQRTQTGATSLTVRETDEDRADTGASTRAKEPQAGLQPRKGTLTPLSYYAHLISLDEHFGKLVDVIAICTKKSADPQRSKSGPKDYHTTLHIADPSSLDSDSSESASSTVVQIFRPVKTSLPTTDRGDAIMLRNFKVQTLNHRFMLLSSETSSWAVLKAPQRFGSTFSEIVVSGPPIEYGLDETACADSLFRWWETGSQSQFPDHSTGTHDENNGRKKSTDVHVPRTPAPPSRSKEQQHRESAPRHSRPSPLPAATTSRRKDNYTDNVNNEDENENEGDWRNTAVVLEDEDEAEEEVVLDKHDANPPPTTTSSSPSRQRGRRASTVSIAPSTLSATGRDAAGRETPTPRRSTRNRASPVLVHELRDGTKYVDHNRRRSGSVVHELRDGVTYVDE
ncbi:hypothetical protein KCU88_g6935, partial [Aureobasidium melanogenum]